MREKKNFIRTASIRRGTKRQLTKIFILLFSLCTFSALAGNIYSQQKELSVRLANTTIGEAFSYIEKNSDYVFLIADDATTSLNHSTHLVVENSSIQQIMDMLLKNTDLAYRVVERQVSVYKKADADTLTASKERAQRQQPPKITVKGMVTDKAKIPLPGVSVRIKGTNEGVATDANGNFSIQVAENAMLEVSYIGMKSQTIAVKGRRTINIIMQENEEILQEVVVTGYQEVKKERMTGSVATISSGDIKNLNIKSMDQVLTGAISGVSSIASGRPGEDARIQIRGINSLTGSTEPIWIIDGMPLQGEAPNLKSTGGSLNAALFQSGIGNISPDDIESITVLKDAAASAIYGARAANGVIVVKTKSGHAGKPHYNITAHFGVTERPTNNIRMMNSSEKVDFETQVFHDLELTGTGRVNEILRQVARGVISQADADQQIEVLRNINTNWFKELYRQSLSTQVNASMSGGTTNTQYYNSLNYLSENGTEYNNHYKRFRFNSKLNHKFSNKVKLQTELSATYRTNRSSAADFGTLSYALYANPYESPDGYDQSWDMSRSRLREGFSWTTFNAKNEIMNNTSSSRYLDASLRARLDWTIIKGLTLSSQGIISASTNNTRTIHGENTYTNFQQNWLNFLGEELLPEQVKGSLREGTSYSNSYTFRNTLEYNLELEDIHFINIFGGQEISDRITYASSNYSPIFDELHRIVGFPELPEGTDLKNINFAALGNTGRFQSKLSSFFLNATYSFKDRYIASSSIRYDGSDIIGNKNQFTPLWNVSGKWNLHNESFFKSKFINALSLRGSYGYTGSIDKDAFPFVLMILGSSITYDDMSVPTEFIYANPNVRWQTKKDVNIGFETSFLKNRFHVGINYYNNLVFDLLDNKSLPMSSGRRSVVENVANVVNKGWEFDLSADVVRYRNFIWNLRGNVALNENIVTKTYYKSLDVLPTITAGKGNRNFVEGYPVSGWFGYRFAEVAPSTGHTMVYDGEGEKFDMDMLSNVTLGLKAPDPAFLGDYYPPIIGGISSNMTWKRWVLTVNLEFKAGNYIKSFNTFRGISSKNRHFSDQSRWRAPGDIASIPAISYNNKAYSQYMYDVVLEKGDYLRNTYTSLGYNLPSSYLQKLGLANARITFTANNLFTLTAYKGIDPALMGAIGYPNSRRYSLSLNIGF